MTKPRFSDNNNNSIGMPHRSSVPRSQKSCRDTTHSRTLTNRTHLSMPTSYTSTSSSSPWTSPPASPRADTASSSSLSAWSVHERELSPIWSTSDGFSPVPHVNFTPLRSPSLAPPHRPSIPCIPLPSQVEHRRPISLHYSLRHTPESTGFDVVDLSSAQRYVQSGVQASYAAGRPSHLTDPATNPPLPSLSIVHPSLPWSIIVHRTQAEYVTVGDVLLALGSNLQIPLDREWSEKVVREHRLSRHELIGRPRLVRLDLLGGRTTFAGLSRSQMGGDVWRLHVR